MLDYNIFSLTFDFDINMNLLNQHPIFFAAIFVALLLFCMKFKSNMSNALGNGIVADSRVKQFTVAVEIPDLPNKYFEGGFHLYLSIPPLKINKLIAYRFDKLSSQKINLGISDLRITFDNFKLMLPQMKVYSRSHNIFNASKVRIAGVLEDGTVFGGEKDIDPNTDRDQINGHIYLDGITLNRLK